MLLKRLIKLLTSPINPAEERKKNQREECLALLQLLDERYDERYDVKAAARINLVVNYPNIEEFIYRIRTIRAALQREEIIPPELVHTAQTRVVLDSFFVSSDGYYLKPSEVISSFTKEGILLCMALEKSDNASYGVDEHNLRVLTRFLQAIFDLTAALLEACNTGSE